MTIPHPQVPQNYATIGQRIGAYLIDNFLYVVVYFVSGFIGVSILFGSSMEGAAMALFMLFSYGVPLGFFAFVVYLAGSKGYTPGKKVLGLRLVDEVTGQPIGFWRVVLRNIVLGLVSIFTCGIGLIVLAVLANQHPRRQGWHDQVAKSVVVPAGAMGYSPPPMPVAPPTGVLKVSLPDQAGENGPPPPPPVSAAGPPPPPPVTPVSQNAAAAPGRAGNQAVPQPPRVPPAPKPGLVGPPPGVAGVVPVPPSVSPLAPVPATSAADDPASTPMITPAAAPVDEVTRMAVRKSPPTPRWSLMPQFGTSQIVSGHVLVGRDPDINLVDGAIAWAIEDVDKTVSKTHALIGVDENQLWIEDWNSTNGVLVRRGESETELKARERFLLENLDIILLGDFEIKVRNNE